MRAFDARVRDLGRNQFDRPDRVVVPWDRVRDMIRIAIAVQDGDHGNIQPGRLLYGNFLYTGVQDEHGTRQAPHVLDARQILLELGDVLLHQKDFLFLKAMLAGVLQRGLHLFHLVDAAADRLKVCQHAAEPPLIDEEHIRPLRFLFKDLRSLAFGADEQNGVSGRYGISNEGIGLLHAGQGLLQIDDVDAVAFAEEELLHFWIPAVRLVPEVHAGFQ